MTVVELYNAILWNNQKWGLPDAILDEDLSEKIARRGRINLFLWVKANKRNNNRGYPLESSGIISRVVLAIEVCCIDCKEGKYKQKNAENSIAVSDT